MNRTVVSGIAAFALLIGATFAMTATTAEAGHCGGGLLAKLHAKKSSGTLFGGGHGGLLHGGGGCGGGLFAKLKAKHAAKSCCAPEPTCCAPEPVCAPEPTCCAPEPTCCDAAPAPACGCEAAPAVQAAPCCGGEVVYGAEAGGVTHSEGTDGGYDLAPDETLVPGSVSTVGAESADVVAPAPVAEAASSSDAPPAPVADTKTDI